MSEHDEMQDLVLFRSQFAAFLQDSQYELFAGCHAGGHLHRVLG